MKLPLICSLILASSARAQMTAPITGPSVRDMHDAFVEAVDDNKKRYELGLIAKTPPRSLADVESLYDLFMRFPDDETRRASLESLQLLSPSAQTLEPLVMRYLNEDDPASALFGIKAALRLRSSAALPVIQKIAARKFVKPTAGEGAHTSDRNAWWAQYEALAALAQWQGEQSLPLLEKKSKEAPAVARLMAMYLWPQTLPKASAWAASGSANDQARASAALDAPVPLGALRSTRDAMLATLRDGKAPPELRHQLALKVGASSTPEEVGKLLKEHDAASDAAAKRLLAAAVFASRDKQAAPLLLDYAKHDPQPGVRAGARVQLQDLLPAADYRALVEWAAQNDPDPENRDSAKRELSSLPQPKK